MQLRDYQEEARDAVLADWHTHNRLLVSLPTATGKTATVASVARSWRDVAPQYNKPDRVLWLAQRDELIWQAAEALQYWTGEEPAIEKGESRIKDSAGLFDRRIVVASVQTMLNDERRSFFGQGEFGMVALDEGHHAPCDGHMKVLDYFGAAKLVGITATCDRADEVSLGKVFEKVSYHYEILDAMKDGWISPIIQEYIEDVCLDFSKVGTDSSGDLSADDLDSIMRQEEPLHKIVSAAVKMAGDRQTMVFAPSVACAEAMADMLRRYGKSAMALSGKTDERERRREVDNFRDGKYQYLTNCGLFTEGADFPKVSCIVMARPTQSRALYSQVIGRGLRGGPRCPVPGKTDCLVIDLVGASMKHRLVHAADLLGGKYDAEVVEAIHKGCYDAAKANGTAANVMEVLNDVVAHAEEIKAAHRRAVIAEAHIKRKTVDPFLVLSDILDVPEGPNPPAWWEDTPCTEEQKDVLEKSGIKAEGDITYAKARSLIQAVKKRRKDGMCSYKQAVWLRARGMSVAMTSAQASALMDMRRKKATDAGITDEKKIRERVFGFDKDDAIRKSIVKKRGGRSFDFNEVRGVPQYMVPVDSPVTVQVSGVGKEHEHVTKRALFVRNINISEGSVTFYQHEPDKVYSIRAPAWAVVNLNNGKRLGEKPSANVAANTTEDF